MSAPTSGSETRCNLDIWLEVLKYLEPDPQIDSEDEVGLKRRTVLSIALSSPVLADVSLSVLWRHMTTLEPIVHVINADTSDAAEKFLIYQVLPPDSGFWVPRRPILGTTQRLRFQKYLGYIRGFHLQQFDIREMMLWPTLVTCLSLDTPLLPNLTTLSIAYQQTSMLSSWIYVAPLITSSIKLFSLSVSSTPVAEIYTTLLQTHRVAPTHIIYRGSPTKKAVQNLLQFPSLQSLRLDFSGDPSERKSSSVPVIRMFKALPHLVELGIDLRVCPISQVESPPLNLSNLLTLGVTGDTPDIGKLLKSVQCPALRSLDVSFPQTWNSAGSPLCSLIPRTFPNLHYLTIGRTISHRSQAVYIEDLTGLLSGLNLRSLRLNNVASGLLQADFELLISSWPYLRVLAIPGGCGYPFVDSRCLIPLIQNTSLHTIDLPLCFRSLAGWLQTRTVKSKSIVTDIECSTYRGVPESLHEFPNLVQNLLRLFPMLRRITGGEAHEDGSLVQVQQAVNTFRELLLDHI
ncbi:hypothetical protein D9756_008602 [Leucocoprinus leucothites]|uniref:F-box domain-containing protein n=1 Tax=Leucocoprinus leucothites TaxID=201217 RepID=A0A8H5FVP7_9AGAR|nr:hypothetical protein D9756_008602 [Leucoagaricus leucothites]